MEAQVAEIAPVGREPEIIPAAEAKTYLASMGIPLEAVYHALKTGEIEASNTSKYAPLTAAGTKRWIAVVEVARRMLDEKENWVRSDAQNRPIAVSSSKEYTLAFVGGNAETGDPRPEANPKAARRKGPATERAHKIEQLSIVLPESITGEIERAENVEHERPRIGNWVLLYYRDKEEIRCEISFPSGVEDGQFTGWFVRVLLESLPYKDASLENTPEDIGGEDIHFYIA